jgi:hypothetical protein
MLKKFDLSALITVSVLVIGFAITWGQSVQQDKDTCQKIDKIEIRQDKNEDDQNQTNKELIAAINNLNIAIAELRVEIKNNQK